MGKYVEGTNCCLAIGKYLYNLVMSERNHANTAGCKCDVNTTHMISSKTLSIHWSNLKNKLCPLGICFA